MGRRGWGCWQGVPTAVLYGSLALFVSILHNVFLLYYVETFVSVYKIDKLSFWVGEVGYQNKGHYKLQAGLLDFRSGMNSLQMPLFDIFYYLVQTHFCASFLVHYLKSCVSFLKYTLTFCLPDCVSDLEQSERSSLRLAE